MVIQALTELGGQAHLSEINAKLQGHPKTLTNPTWRDTIRRVVRQYATFEPVLPIRSGVYKLINLKQSDVTAQKLDSYIKLLQMGARWYDYDTGRFTQPDTIIPNPYNPQSLNRYAYGLNNPVNLVDPSGHAPQNPGDPDDMQGDCTTDWCWQNRWFAAHGYNWDNNKSDWVMPGTPNPRFYDEAITDAILAEGNVRLCGESCAYQGGSSWSWDQKKVVARGLSIFGGKLINEGGIGYLARLLGVVTDVYLDSPSAPVWCSYACAPPKPFVGMERSIFLSTGLMNYANGYMDVVHELAHIVDWHSSIGGRRFSNAWQGGPLTQYAIDGTLQPAERFAEAAAVWVFYDSANGSSTYRNAILQRVTDLTVQLDRMEALLKGWE